MQIIPLEQTPEFQEIAQTIMYWNDAEYLHKSGSASFEIWEATRKLMTAGEIASFLITPEFNPGLSVEQLVSQLEQAMMVSTNRDTQSARLEAYRLYPDEMVQRVRGPMGLGWTGSAIAFHASSPNVERGLQFLNWVQSSQENYDMLLYGLEGQHYELSSNGQIAYPAGMNFQNSTYMGWSGRWAFENIRFDRTPQGFPETSKEQRVAYIREKTRYAPHEGFFLDTEALDVFYEQRALALVELIYFPLLNGSYKPEETGAIIDGLNQSGAETLVEMVQQQLNLWRSAQ